MSDNNEFRAESKPVVLSDDREQVVDEWGRRAGAALRSPAPDNGVAAIQRRVRNQRIGRVGAVAGVVAVIAIGLAVVGRADDSTPQRPGDIPDTVVVTEPHAPTTVAVLSDEQIANATLLAANEYAPDWMPAELGQVKMNATIAERVPACAPFLDTAFEGPARPATVATTWLSNLSIGSELQYVAVFPSDAAAQAMFEATTSPAFLDGCVAGYTEQLPKLTAVDLIPYDYVFFPFSVGDHLETPVLQLDADQASLRSYQGSFSSISGTRVPGGQLVAATVRVGRVIAIVEGILETPDGQSVLDQEQFRQAVSKMIQRARAALDNHPLLR